jgi:D-alanine transaminase
MAKFSAPHSRSVCLPAIGGALDAAEAFVTSASTFVLPAVSIDGDPIGAGIPGDRTKRLRELYISFARVSAT